MLPLILTAVIATDLAVVIMFITMHRRITAAQANPLEAPASTEVEQLVSAMRSQLDQSALELARQKAQLRRMLDDLAQQATKPGTPPPPPTPILSRRDVLRMAAEGMSLRAIAGRTGLSVEEVRLMLAMEDEADAA
ncbi:MAG: hypothetical protein U0531_15745 [Dehalococcoidia bacterium]